MNSTSLAAPLTSWLQSGECLSAVITLLNQVVLGSCSGFDWDSINSLHGSLQGAVLDLSPKQCWLQECFSCCWAAHTQHQGLLHLSRSSPARAVSAHQVRMGHSQDSWPKGCPTPWYLSKKSWGEKEEGGKFGIIVLPSHCYIWWNFALWDMAEHLLAHGRGRMNSLFYFPCVCMAFILPVKLPLSEPMNFLPSTFLFLSHSHWGVQCPDLWGWAAPHSQSTATL